MSNSDDSNGPRAAAGDGAPLGADRPTLAAEAARVGPRQLAFAPPYYAVIFSSLRNNHDDAGYGLMAERMVALASQQPGYLGMHSVRGADGLGITVSYWRSTDDIRAWREVAEHRVAQQAGRQYWYAGFELQVARVERAYAYGAELTGAPHSPAAAATDTTQADASQG